MQTIAAVVSAMITLIAVGLSWRVYTYQRTQAHFALALSLHEKLTTGEVATARDVLHPLQYGDETVRGLSELGKRWLLTIRHCGHLSGSMPAV